MTSPTVVGVSVFFATVALVGFDPVFSLAEWFAGVFDTAAIGLCEALFDQCVHVYTFVLAYALGRLASLLAKVMPMCNTKNHIEWIWLDVALWLCSACAVVLMLRSRFLARTGKADCRFITEDFYELFIVTTLAFSVDSAHIVFKIFMGLAKCLY